MLTRKQKELLLFIRESLSKEGVTPSFDEMKTALGLKSKSGIHRLITGLEERGFIKRLPHRARALEIMRAPEEPAEKSARFGKKIKDAVEDAALSVFSLSLYGRIAAGTPIEAISDPQDQVEVPPSLIANARGGITGDHYVLEIAGDSMMEAGIMNGDYVVIRRAETAENGAIVVALVDDHEATLKYLERRGRSIALVPANKNYEERLLDSSRVKVQGQLVGLVRKYVARKA